MVKIKLVFSYWCSPNQVEIIFVLIAYDSFMIYGIERYYAWAFVLACFFMFSFGLSRGFQPFSRCVTLYV